MRWIEAHAAFDICIYISRRSVRVIHTEFSTGFYFSLFFIIITLDP